MKDRITAFIAILLLASLAGVSYWYSQTTRLKKISSPLSREGPDFVVNGVSLTQFDETGRATNRLHASQLMHFAADDHSELLQPRLISLRPNQPQLEARAKSANVESGGERVLLSGDVVVTRAPGRDGSPPMQLRTQQLTAIPDLDRYSTDVAAEIENGDSVVRSIGMDYDNVQRVVKFRSQVRGTLAPTAPGEER
ncbi:MAG: LPS export ABC transporter periplasmic protein LptC [Pseudomonadota bacterium]|nr:LPS export ABC transporter periplasmic protein LptC [Burkholderiaceae bacterium]MDQ3445086.1 LPS export ABC transporter periplasmic protein LptC [Pseudomonadota bacterium]